MCIRDRTGHVYELRWYRTQTGRAGEWLTHFKAIQPVRHPWGVWHFPIFYMDNMDFSSGCFWSSETEGPFSDTMIEAALADDGVYVFDFHPIHLLLNTPERARYFSVRDRFKAGVALDQLVYAGNGTRRFYERLCAAMARDGLKSLSLGQALDAHLSGQRPKPER